MIYKHRETTRRQFLQRSGAVATGAVCGLGGGFVARMISPNRQATLPNANMVNQKTARGTDGMVATAHSGATAAGNAMLLAGGNAVDAAVAAGLALAVCEPSGSGIGGMATMLIHQPDGQNILLEGHSYAPAAVSLKTVSAAQQSAGYRACVVPSMVATLGSAHQRFGNLPWARVLAPAIQLAEEGFPITPLQRRQMGWCQRLLCKSPVASAYFLDDGHPFAVGTVFRQVRLADALRRLARHGAEDFYRGGIARDIAEDMRLHDGLMTATDLAGCRLPVERTPATTTYRGYDLVSTPPPGGGLEIFLGLKILECLGDDVTGDDDRWYETLAEVTHTVFRERENWTIHARDYTPELGQGYLAPARMRALAQSVRNHKIKPMATEGEKGGDTTHLCTADDEGRIVSLTQSIQSLFGARVVNERCGFLYNNYLRTCPRGRHPYQLGPGSWPRSNASPTLILTRPANNGRNGGRDAVAGPRPFLTLGSAGSRRIISSILQSISRVIDRGMTIGEALAAPRIHGMLSRTVWLERPAATSVLRQRLDRYFKDVAIKPAHSYAMASVQAIQFQEDGVMIGAADPRRDGSAVGV